MRSLFFAILFFGSALVADSLDKVFGDNDLVAVSEDGSNIPLRYKKILNAFGQTSESCTATHIGRGYVLTAGHCFWAPPEMIRHTKCSDTQVSWGLRGEQKPYLVSQCEEIVAAQRSFAGDFAILKVSPVPETFIPVELKRRAAIGDSLTVFSHPDELALHWSKHCGVERPTDPFLPVTSLKHQCDTNPGSSGATLLNLVTLKVVGIHDGGYIENGTGMNYGSFIMDSPLLDVLKELGFN